MSRLIAIGDIHGSSKALNLLLDRVKPEASDRLVFLGDYVDRGSDTSGVIASLIRLKKEFPRTIFLRGNHDQLMLDALAEWGNLPGWPPLRTLSPLYRERSSPLDSSIWLINGGIPALTSYGITLAERGEETDLSALPTEHLQFLQQTLLWWAEDGYLFVHAGSSPHLAPEEQDPYTLLWDRSAAMKRSDGLVEVVGHTPTADGLPLHEPGRIRLDTGACFGRALTALELHSNDIWQATESGTVA